MPNSLKDYSSIAGINQEIAATWDTFRWFLGMHYKFNKKLDTPYWKWCAENTEIGDAALVIDLFLQRPPLSASHFGTLSPYTALEALVFNSYSYDTLIYGQKILKAATAPEMSKTEYFGRVEAYKNLTEISLSQSELFDGDHLTNDGLLEMLFSEHDTWINETEA